MDDKRLENMLQSYMSEEIETPSELLNITKMSVRKISKDASCSNNRLVIYLLSALSSILFIIQLYLVFTNINFGILQIGLVYYFATSVVITFITIIYYNKKSFSAFFSSN